MEFHSFTLANGMRVIFKESDREVAHCGLVINAGSRDEMPHEQGLAHFIEHSIFKGTTRRKTYHILSRLDSVGAEINAYTSKEETWIYASFLRVHFERAAELISDICFNSIFPEREINKEKDVIIDEINAYQDSPGEQIFDDFEATVFRDHPLGNNILGTAETVKSFSREDVFNFIQRRYLAEQMVFSVVGNFSLKTVRKVAEKYFAAYQNPKQSIERLPFSGYTPRDTIQERDTHQVHYVIGAEAYPVGHDKHTGMVIVNNILGGPGMNSRLNLMIREKHGIAYNIESHYQGYSDTGLFEIYLGTDIKTFEKSKRLVFNELKRLREQKLGIAQLHAAKQQLIGQIALAQESGAGTMMALGKSLMLFDRVDTLEEVFNRIESVTAEEIMEVSNEIFEPGRLSSITYL